MNFSQDIVSVLPKVDHIGSDSPIKLLTNKWEGTPIGKCYVYVLARAMGYISLGNSCYRLGPIHANSETVRASLEYVKKRTTIATTQVKNIKTF